ncbi:TetR/AcrR family transcriptional regulator [Isoptericola halotolerans]|uniref:AcrR family transcriptional regulator n=1 Tax=Isoptericola halotolerans TaxID=300560 RepID=A0ABX2A3V0_9MICO|nr:TetR/AcrR family transcriptional regulator [Isoptericola halotolerans]NOV97493.1 AcrR family transcriptional regulator [Isoptericola halotolerans]
MSTAPSDRARARVGRPRDDAIDDAVLAATIVVLDEVGYARLSLGDVARRAGTSKPALYRRWPSRQHLVLAALERRIGSVRPPDTSCTMCDLAECLGLFVEAFEQLPPGVLAPLLADSADDAALRAELMARLFDPPREAVRRTLSRARERGDLRAELGLDLAVDLLGSFVHYRALFGHAPTTPEEIETAVETLLQGLATDYDSLLAHAQGVEVVAQPHELHAYGGPSQAASG